MVYALPLPLGFKNYTIMHLEILNLVVGLKVWGTHWKDKTVEIKCDNMAVVKVLRSGHARDSVLVMCACNTWLLCAMFNIQLVVNHIPGCHNVIADLLSGWQADKHRLHTIIPHHSWVPVHTDLTRLNEHIQCYFLCRGTGRYGTACFCCSATMNQYTRMFKVFLFFLEKAQISPFQVTTAILLAFMKYLHQKGLSQSNISNHMQEFEPCL